MAAGLPRYIPSDYAADFMKTAPSHNRNFDLRREFVHRAERAPIALTWVLTGAFMNMLNAEMPIIQSRVRRVPHWGSVDQPLDFTMKDDVAYYVASVDMDTGTPRVLSIASDTRSARELAGILTEVTGERYRTLPVGGSGGPTG